MPRNEIVFDLRGPGVAPKALTLAKSSQIRIFVGKIPETSLGTSVKGNGNSEELIDDVYFKLFNRSADGNLTLSADFFKHFCKVDFWMFDLRN